MDDPHVRVAQPSSDGRDTPTLRSSTATASAATGPPSQSRHASPDRQQRPLATFAAGYAMPYGNIPPPSYSQKGKGRAADVSLSCDECEAAALAALPPHQAEADERLSLSFARTRKASHARAKSIGSPSADDLGVLLADDSLPYRTRSTRRLVGEEDLRRRIARGMRDSSRERDTNSRPSRDEGAEGSTSRRSASDRSRRSRRSKADSSTSSLKGLLSLRSGGVPQASTGTAAQYGKLLGHPILASASLSAPEKSSIAATCAAIPSLYNTSRGRSANVSPSHRWGRRSASASVLSGSEDASDPELTRRSLKQTGQASPSGIRHSAVSTPTRSRETSQDGALFPSDDEDEDDLSVGSSDEVASSPDKLRRGPRRRRSRRWSSVERERKRGMQILLSPSIDAEEERNGEGRPAARRSSLRPSSLSSELTVTSDCPSDLDASASSCSSSSDIAGETRRAMEALAMAIPIQPRSRRAGSRSPGGAYSFPNEVSASLETSTPSLSSSAPSSSLVQQSPPPIQPAIKPIVPIPVLSGSDPLLGITMSSIEDMIEVDQVEFCKEDSASETDQRPPSKRGRKLSWIIGDLDDEDDEDALRDPGDRPSGDAPRTPPQQSPQSYQARLAGLQSHFRLWSRSNDEGRERQTSVGSDDATEPPSASPGLLSNSWRSLARLPNLILLPGLAARQARDAAVATAQSRGGGIQGGAGAQAGDMADLASIFRHASVQDSLSEDDVEARRKAALRMGRPPSPSPSPSPPTSLNCSRQSSSESIGISHQRSARQPSAGPKKGRGVANPIEGDYDPSAYVSGIGQPIDPDTELASVVHLQTFRSRSRSRSNVDRSHRASEDDKREGAAAKAKETEGAIKAKAAPTPEHKTTQEPATSGKEAERSSRRVSPLELSVVIPTFDSDEDSHRPRDIASAPTSPTYRRRRELGREASDPGSSSSSSSRVSEEDEDGFRRFQTRRQRRRSSGPRSTRPKAEALVPRDFSAFAIDEEAEGQFEDEECGPDSASASESDSERVCRGRPARGRGRAASPTLRLGKRQCAVGLFGGGLSPRRRDGSTSSVSSFSSIGQGVGIRTVRSSPDLTYAAAAARGPSSSPDGEDDGPSPPRGSRGRRGAVKVVASSVGQTVTSSKALTMNQHLRRGPSYPPRAGAGSGPVVPSAAAADNTSAGPAGHGAVFSSPTPPTQIRLRLLSNSAHLLMLSLELEMIKKHKISGPLKPRWGKHRANDFVPLPKKDHVVNKAGVASAQSRHDGWQEARDAEGAATAPAAVPDSAGHGSAEVVGSRLKFSWAPPVV